MAQGRQKPVILDQRTNKDTYEVTYILVANNVYAVTYDGNPIAVCNEPQHTSRKYPKTMYPHKGHALNLAAKLNQQFNCTRFGVKALVEVVESA